MSLKDGHLHLILHLYIGQADIGIVSFVSIWKGSPWGFAGPGKLATTNGQAAMSTLPPQPHLTPAQAAAQAAINSGIAHQNGVVPVRTGLAWAPGGTANNVLQHLPHLPQVKFASSTAKVRRLGKSWRICSKHCNFTVRLLLFLGLMLQRPSN